MGEIPESRRLARELVGRAEAGEQVEVCAGSSVRTEIRVYDGDVESLTVAESRGVGVRVIRDGREGLAHAGSWDPDVIDTLLAEARDNMSFAEPDDRVGLAEPDGVDAADIDPWDDRIEASASIGTQPLIDDPDGSTRTGYAGDAAAAPQLLDIEEVARLAVERGVRLLGAGPPTTGRPLVVLEPRFTATILGIVAGMLSGELVVKGRTPFGDRVGEAIATEALTMFDDPTDPDSLSASAFDGEGLACRRVPLISEGVLQGFLHDARSARGLGVSSTGSALRSVRGTPSPGHRSLSVGPGEGDLDAFIASIDDGLLIASLQGLHSGVNAVSGDFSVGVEGVVIRNGELAEPIREGTLAGAIPRMLLDVARVGADLERQPGGTLVPSLVLDGLTLGGGSGA